MVSSDSRRRFPKLSSGQWITAAVIAFLVLAMFYDVVDSLKEVASAKGATTAQLNGKLPDDLVVGRAAQITLALDDTGGAAMDPACVGGNLSAEFKVTKVTFLGTPAGKWRDDRACGEILETNSTVPVVITVVPLHPGTYFVRVLPQVRSKTVGTGTKGNITVLG